MSIPRKSLSKISTVGESSIEPIAATRVSLLKNKRFQPIKTADNQHHVMVALNRNFLPLLLNPTDDLTITQQYALTVSGSVLVQSVERKFIKKDLILPDSDNHLPLQVFNNHQDWNSAHIPTRLEYQVFLGILSLTQQFKTTSIYFKSWRNLLLHLGLEVNGEHLRLVKRTLEVFFNLVVTFDDSWIQYKLQNGAIRYKQNGHKKQCFILEGYGNYKSSSGETSTEIYINFDPRFHAACELPSFVQKIDVTKVMQFKSSKALSLYLYLLRWCEKLQGDKKVVFTRKQAEDINFLYALLGWRQPQVVLEDGTVEKLIQPSRVKILINQAIKEIKSIDSRFDFSLDEDLLEEGLIRFDFPEQDLM